MNSRERFLNTFLNQETDRKMRFDCVGFWPETLNRWKHEGLDEILQGKNIYEYFQMDRLAYVDLISGYTSPYCPLFDKQQVCEDDNTITIIDFDGIKKKLIKKDIYMSMPQFLEFPVKTKADYIAVRKRLMPDTKGRLGISTAVLKEAYKYREQPLGMYVCGGFAHLRELMGLEFFLITMYDEPEFIHEIMADWLSLYIALTTDIIRAANLDFIYIWEDMCYKNGPLLAPEMYREFVCPYMKKLISVIKQEGTQIILLDSDGDMTKLIDLYITCGVNVLFPFEVQAGMDIVEIRRQYPDLGIIGGIDKRALASGRSEIDREVLSKIPEMYRQGRYIAALDHSVPPDVALNEYIYYTKLLRSLEND